MKGVANISEESRKKDPKSDGNQNSSESVKVNSKASTHELWYGAVKDNAEVLQSALNSIVKVCRVKEWVNTRGEKIRESADAG